MNEEAHPEAAAILRDAGWKPHDGWGVYTRGTLVMGFSPDGQHFDVKNTATAPDSPDTPDDPVEAALWLVRLRAPAVVIDDVVGYDPPTPLVDDQWPMEGLEPETRRPIHIEPPMPVFEETAEAAYGGEDETHGETGEAAADLHDYARADSVPEDAGQSGDVAAGGESEDWHAGMGEGSAGHGGAAGVPEQDWGGGGDGDLPEAPIDADFAPIEDEPPERDALDADLTPLRGIAWDENTVADELGAEILDEGQAPQDRFIGLDDLDRRRSLRIGDVIRYALEHMPRLTPEQVQRLQQLRSYVAGVAESTVTRSSGDAELRAELDALEAASSLEAKWKGVRDDKVTFLNEASREDVEAFDPAADWP